MEWIATVLACVSAAAAVASVRITAKARADSHQAALAASSAEHRASKPRLALVVDGSPRDDADVIIYRVTHVEGPALRSLAVHRPRREHLDGSATRMPVSATGRTDWSESVDLGPTAISESRRFTLSIGTEAQLPELRVKIVAVAYDGRVWELSEILETPRDPKRRALELTRAQLQEVESRRRADSATEVAHNVSYTVRGGAGVGVDTPQWRMTSLHVSIRNDTGTTISRVILVLGDSAFVWRAPEPIRPGGTVGELVDLEGALPGALQSEASGRPLTSYPSKLYFQLQDRKFVREGDLPPRISDRDVDD